MANCDEKDDILHCSSKTSDILCEKFTASQNLLASPRNEVTLQFQGGTPQVEQPLKHYTSAFQGETSQAALPLKRCISANREKVAYSTELEEINCGEFSFRLIKTFDAAAIAISQLQNCNFLAVDCEGSNLSRTGALTVLQIAQDEHLVYIFDVLALGRKVFESGLKEILESANVTKLMFDCRSDSDALYHQFNVKLCGVRDLQLYEMLIQESEPTRKKKPTRKWHATTPTLRGFGECLKEYAPEKKKLIEVKAEMNKGLQNHSMWSKRPLTGDVLTYAATDVIGCFLLYDTFKKILPLAEKETEKLLNVSSDRYVSYKRDFCDPTTDWLCNSNLLPFSIIPNKSGLHVDYSDPHGNVKCHGCQRYFSEVQLDMTTQLCHVCKEYKRVNQVKSGMNWKPHTRY